MTAPGPWGQLDPVEWAVQTCRIDPITAPAWQADLRRRPDAAAALLSVRRGGQALVDRIAAVLPAVPVQQLDRVVTGPPVGNATPSRPAPLSVLLWPSGPIVPVAPATAEWLPVLVVDGVRWQCRRRVAHLRDSVRITAAVDQVLDRGQDAVPVLYVAVWQGAVLEYARWAPWLLEGGTARVYAAVTATVPLVAGYEARRAI